MNPKHFHTPPSTRARCPVCHEAVYSRAGIHPQCAVRQSDPPKAKNKPQKPPLLPEPVTGATEPAEADAIIEPPVVGKISPPDRIPV